MNRPGEGNLVVRTIHRMFPRRKLPTITSNCLILSPVDWELHCDPAGSLPTGIGSYRPAKLRWLTGTSFCPVKTDCSLLWSLRIIPPPDF
jgi:hypothetical protein